MAREKVLVTDQDLNHLTRIYLALVHRNFKAEACNIPEELRDRIKRFRPAVIILTLNEYRELSEKLKIPAIVMVEQDENTTPVNDGDIVLVKPVQADALIKAVESLI